MGERPREAVGGIAADAGDQAAAGAQRAPGVTNDPLKRGMRGDVWKECVFVSRRIGPGVGSQTGRRQTTSADQRAQKVQPARGDNQGMCAVERACVQQQQVYVIIAISGGFLAGWGAL